MPFSPALKLRVKRKAHFRCVWCEKFKFIEVHHIIPERDEGPNTEDNAVPLCPDDHTLYGENPGLRNFMRQKRDWWYDICETKMTFENVDELEEFNNRLENVEDNREELIEIISNLSNEVKRLSAEIETIPEENKNEVYTQMTSTSDVLTSLTQSMYQPVGQFVLQAELPRCPNCKEPTVFFLPNGKCPNCSE